MNRLFILGSLTLLVFLLGIFRISSSGKEVRPIGSKWSGTQFLSESRTEEALLMLASSSRWDIESPDKNEAEESLGFSVSYKLIAVISNEERYALLTHSQTVHGAEVRKVFVGDRLSHDWVVTDIQNAAVVATKQDESQRVELFPTK